MAMGPERSRPLHNFTLPCELKWGNRKFLRCVKLDSNGEIAAVHRRSDGLSEPSTGRRQVREMGVVKKFGSDVGDGIASVREKLMLDLQTAADKMKDAILREGLKDELPPAVEEVEEELFSAAAADPNKPWSLRTRRTAFKGTNAGSNVSPLICENKSPILPSGEKRERAKLSVPLSRLEIEEDFMAIVGHRPARRPKKRSKLVQKNLDTLFPGLWLTEITTDLYKVPDDQ